ncbi:MAG: efflux RND transporter periplasmic adaptor subunit [Planctomycetota bacterium]
MIDKGHRERGLPFIRRADLVIQQVRSGEHVYWTVKDPVSLAFFQLREEEHFIFTRLTRDATVDSLVSAFERVFSPVRLSLVQLDAYLKSLLAMGLIVDRFADGSRLVATRERLGRVSWMASLGNPLVVRWRGIDPSPLLRWVDPMVRWCFTPAFVYTSVALMLLSSFWMIIHHEDLLRRLPAMSAFVSVHNLVWIALAIGVAKIVHEFAHALTCRHFGGQCHEMGLMLLVFTPCLYCNVSDAWMMPSRWHRIAVSGAGIFIELLMAAVSSLVWWFSEPGVLNSICMNMMIVCSINTVLFNGNPLLKYDGYYVLADLVEVPNLAARAKNRLVDVIMRIACGVQLTNPRSSLGRGNSLLVIYGLAALIYRWFVLALILWSLHQLLRPIGLVVIAQIMTVSCFITFLYSGWRSARATVRKLSTRPVRRLRWFVSLGVLFFLIYLIWNRSIGQHVTAPVTVSPADATTVYVEESGRITEQSVERVWSGDSVRRGDVLAVLENPELSREILQLRERIEALRLRIKLQEESELRRGRANENLPSARELLASLDEQMERFRVRHGKLTIRANEGGTLMKAPPKVPNQGPHQLRSWIGSPMDASNVGCTLQRGTTYCLIGDPSRLSATLVVDEADIELLRVGQPAQVWLRENPGRVITGEVRRISSQTIEAVPEGLIRHDDVKMINDGAGQTRMANTAYHVEVSLDDVGTEIPLRSTGWAKITVPQTTVGTQIKQYFLRTFRLSRTF